MYTNKYKINSFSHTYIALYQFLPSYILSLYIHISLLRKTTKLFLFFWNYYRYKFSLKYSETTAINHLCGYGYRLTLYHHRYSSLVQSYIKQLWIQQVSHAYITTCQYNFFKVNCTSNISRFTTACMYRKIVFKRVLHTVECLPPLTIIKTLLQ